MTRQGVLARPLAVICVIAAMTAVLATALAGDEGPRRITDNAKLFQTLDTDVDGIVREAEIDTRHKRLFHRLVRRADADNDGALSADEWKQGFEDNRVDRPLETLPDEVGEDELPTTVFALLDRDRNGSLAKDEVPPRTRSNWDRLLKLADRDGDGTLDRGEFLRRYPRIAHRSEYGIGRAKELTPEMLGRLDTDGNGVVQLDELPDQRRQQLLRLFALADQDADGGLDRDEVTAGLAAMQRAMTDDLPVQPPRNAGQQTRTAAQVLERAMRLDVSGDGLVDRDEARGRLANKFQKIDADGSGSLDRNELSQAAQRFLKRRRQRN